ncbi:MAG: O-antigen ligase family protein [Bacteroidales bacterium]|nr:O-antigen ligase family protein [Bacteroidales bacterium]
MIFQKPVKYYIKYSAVFFALAVSFWIPMYRWVLSYFIGGWILFSIINAFFSAKKKFKYNSENIFFLIIQLLLFTLIIISYFTSENKEKAGNDIVQKMSLLIFPVLFFFSGNPHKKYKEVFLKLFVISALFVSVLSLVVAFYNSADITEGKLLFDASVLGKKGFTESITHGGNYFFYSNLSVFHHPAYFSMYIVFSVSILFYFKDNSIWFNRSNHKILYHISILFLLLTVFLLSSRAGILSAVLLIAFRIIFVSYRSRKYLLLAGYSIVFIISVFYVSKHERVASSINDVKYLLHENVSQTKPPARVGLWKTAIKVTKDNFWLGAGIGDIKKVFSEEYKKYDFAEPDKIGYNAHNQFLDTFMTIGVFAFILLTGIFVAGFIRAFRKRQLLFIIFLSLTFFNFLFESMFNTIAGVVFFFYFFNYFVFIYNTEKEKTTNTIIS